jgi:hypothetical protein
MNRILLLVPLIALLGCDAANTTTPPANKPGPRAVSTARPQATTPLHATSSSRAESARTETPADPRAKSEDPPARPVEFEERKEDPPEEAPPIPETSKPINTGKTIFFEKKEDGTRHVHLMAEVCLREGPLEVFLCKNFTKEHEAILRCDADAREIHAALLLAGAQAGSPAKFVPKFQPPTGTKIKVSVTYREKGKVKTAPASEWVKDKVSGKDLMYDWVFAGSRSRTPARRRSTWRTMAK